MIGEGGGLVEQHPIRNSVAQSAGNEFNVVCKTRARIATGPASGIFEGLRQIPVIECDEWPQTRLQQGIDETAVIIDASGIGCAGSRRLYARPRNREAIAVQIHRAREGNVFLPAMSQIDSPLPSAFHPPSIWYEAVEAPQKKFFGKVIGEGESNSCACGILRATEVAVRAALETLHAENKLAGNAAAAPVAKADWANLRRVRRKAE